MSLYHKQAMHQVEMADVLCEVIDFFILADSDTNVAEVREKFIRKIGEVLDFDETYVEKAIQGEITKEDLG